VQHAVPSPSSIAFLHNPSSLASQSTDRALGAVGERFYLFHYLDNAGNVLPMLVHASIHLTLALSALVYGLPYYTTTFHFRLSPAQVLSLHLPVFQILGWSVLLNSQLFAKVIGHHGQVKLP
jgi:hypothetical protein